VPAVGRATTLVSGDTTGRNRDSPCQTRERDAAICARSVTAFRNTSGQPTAETAVQVHASLGARRSTRSIESRAGCLAERGAGRGRMHMEMSVPMATCTVTGMCQACGRGEHAGARDTAAFCAPTNRATGLGRCQSHGDTVRLMAPFSRRRVSSAHPEASGSRDSSTSSDVAPTRATSNRE